MLGAKAQGIYYVDYSISPDHTNLYYAEKDNGDLVIGDQLIIQQADLNFSRLPKAKWISMTCTEALARQKALENKKEVVHYYPKVATSPQPGKEKKTRQEFLDEQIEDLQTNTSYEAIMEKVEKDQTKSNSSSSSNYTPERLSSGRSTKPFGSSAKTESVSGYTKKNGTYVAPYKRRPRN